MNWDKALTSCLQSVERGREVLLHYFGQLSKVQEKGAEGLVSEADLESERVISAQLKRTFPDLTILGEEAAFKNTWSIPDSGWILDPLDGTTNYVHGFPVFCISLGLRWEGQLQLAVVDVPLLNQTFTAIRGQGAYLNGSPIHVSQRSELKSALVATGFSGTADGELAGQMRVFQTFIEKSRGVRRPGSAAYDLCMVATGTYDAFWECGLKPWDVAAGALLVREAGGLVRNYDGQDYRLGDRGLVASNQNLASTVLSIVQVGRTGADGK